jgi:acyl carrier protein
MDKIKSEVKDFILTEFLPGEDPASLTDDVPLVSGGVLDSIATLKLVMFMEERFGISLEAHETGKDHLDTLDAIAALIRTKTGQA